MRQRSKSPARQPGWLSLVQIVIVTALVGAVTNVFTGILPKEWTWAEDWKLMGSVLAALVLLLVILTVVQHRRGAAAAPPGPVIHRAEVVYTAPVTGAPHPPRRHPAPDWPARLPRLGDVANQPLALRVHQAIPLPGNDAGQHHEVAPAPWWRPPWWKPGAEHARRPPSGPDPALPTFVARDVQPEVQAWMRQARRDGGMLVVVGDSSVGKTRLLYEVVRAELGDITLLAPDLGNGDMVNDLAERIADDTLPPLLVWLDELQRFLPGPYLTPGSTPITPATVRRLLDAATPVVIVGTLWPAHATELRALDTDASGGPAQPRHPGAYDVLSDERLHDVPLESFSEAERIATVALAPSDPRLGRALAVRDFNVTETLAGAPRLIRRYQQARGPAQAVLHAAVDARRLGIQAPLTAELLCACARGYLTTAHPDDSALERAIIELTEPEPATAPLRQEYDAERRRVLGYSVADYLLQQVSRQRRTAPVPAVTWQALVDHPHSPEDRRRLALSADNRRLYGHARSLLRQCADDGDPQAGERLVRLLVEQDDVDGLRSEARSGNTVAAENLAKLLAAHGRVRDLRERADEGDRFAAELLAEALARNGNLAELRQRADTGQPFAATYLAEALARHGHLVELRDRADSGDRVASARLVDLLARTGDVEELRARAEAGDRPAAERLGDLLAGQGDLDALRSRADAGDFFAAERLAGLLAGKHLLDELRTRADAGDEFAARRLASVLAGSDDHSELRDRADRGDRFAARELAGLLCGRDDLSELRERADAGEWFAARRLVEQLAERGHIDDLRDRAEGGDEFAAGCLVALLVKRGDVTELRRRADTGDEFAARRLVGLLVKQGNLAELRKRSGADPVAARRLAVLLAAEGRLEELRARAGTGDRFAAEQLAAVLARAGDVTELRERADAGDRYAAEQLVGLLVEQRDFAGLRAEVVAGTATSARRLVELLAIGDDADRAEAQRIRRWGLGPDGSTA
ncbi:hypothetical protein AB0F81_43800 [Actinoplanes sp. NPDC024001]|uniref:hypothetical protein n=1 Tax=Actinoplanes sp. NPDC024001 TaxID=3154598 RepID=UPI0033D28958